MTPVVLSCIASKAFFLGWDFDVHLWYLLALSHDGCTVYSVMIGDDNA